MYLVRTPWLIKKFYPDCTWDFPPDKKVIYLTFDDGPHPSITKFVLAELKKYNAKATFFCIGKNVVAHPDVYRQISNDGHATGNHTYDHLNGWKTEESAYLKNIEEAKGVIDSGLFRPPYGRISRRQLKIVKEDFRVIMWTVLAGDFDTTINGEKCYQNVIRNSRPGSIIVFHDSEKAKERIVYALPLVLKYFSENGYEMIPIRSGLYY